MESCCGLMRMRRLVKWIALVAIMACSVPLNAQKIVKVKNVQGRWQVSDNITLKEAEERALNEAKKEALRRAGVMENVWSVFGQITQESGTEFEEAYSQMNILAIGGMVNITKQKVEEVWDTDTRSLYKVVTIDAEVKKDDEADKAYALEVSGFSPVYKVGDSFTCKLRVFGTNSYLKFFWFDSNGGSLLYPNDYEGNQQLEVGKEYQLPFHYGVQYLMDKQSADSGSEKINMMWVATKDDIPFTGEVTYENVLKWIYAIPNSRRCAHYDMVMIK